MSRVTTVEQYQRHQRARELYLALPQVYSLLSPAEQWTIYSFYNPQGDHTPQSLRVLQQAARRGDPSLPNRAGKTIARMELLVAHIEALREQSAGRAALPEPSRRKGTERRISVFGDVVPEVDLEALAHVLVQAAFEAAARDRAYEDDQQKSA